MDEYKIILEEKQTVMARYEVEPKSGEGYQSEARVRRNWKMRSSSNWQTKGMNMPR